ncbi:MAG: ABC transporter substrate-binding protein [Ilumatobacter sp.]|nr:ABC transporter substrate-binding protein [Ilumatobacter sp.]
MTRTAPHRTSLAAAFVLVPSLVAAACTSDDPSTPETTAPAPSTTEVPARVVDDTLTIGLLLPTADPVLGQGLVSAATEAVTRVNAAGGVLGRDVRISIQDEGTSAVTAAAGIAALLDDDVDAVVGPSSSLIALSTLDDLVSAGVATCSPTASALALDDYPDEGLFFRTIPSDSLQAIAIADVAERTGVRNVAVVYVDDAYGRPFARAVEDALSEGSRSVDAVETFGFVRSDGALDALATRVADSGARVVIVLAASDDGTAVLEALSRTDFGSLTDIVVNDAFRNPAAQPLIQTLDPALRDLITGLAPQAQSNDDDRPFDPPGLFAAHAFDCVTLIALAVTLVRSDDPAQFASQIPALTTGGRVCDAFDGCAELLDDDRDINYNGPDGITELLQVGDPARARFDQFVFDETGRAVFVRPVVASSV